MSFYREPSKFALLKVLVFQRVAVGDDGFAVRAEQRAEPARVARGVEEIVHAGFTVDPDFIGDGDAAFAQKFNKTAVLFHVCFLPYFMVKVYHIPPLLTVWRRTDIV